MAKKLTMIIASALLFFSQNVMAQKPKFQQVRHYCCMTYEMNDTENCDKWDPKSLMLPHPPYLYNKTKEGEKIKPRTKLEELIIQAAIFEMKADYKNAEKKIDEAIEKYKNCFASDGLFSEIFYLDLLKLKIEYQIRLNKIRGAESDLQKAYSILKILKSNEDKSWGRYWEEEQKTLDGLKGEINAKKKR
jgi:hypothetical protein